MKRWSKAVVALLTGLLLIGGMTSAAASPPKVPQPQGKSANAGPPPNRQPKLESVYVPIRPCRIVDTRSAAAGKFAPSTTRTFRMRGTSGFVPQGGTNGGCGVPASATGVSVNTTMTSISGSGHLSNYPVGGTASTTNFTTFAAGGQLTSNPTFALATAGTEPSLAIRSSSGANTHLIIDVTGYYAPQIEGLLHIDGGLYSGSPALVSANRTATGTYSLVVDRDVTYCAINAQAYTYGYEAHGYL